MPLADVTAYSVGLFIHIVAVLVGLGPTFGYAVVQAYVERFAPQAVPAVYRGFQRTDRILVSPGLIVVLAAGLYLMSEGDISFGESWVSVGLAALIVLLGMTHAYFGPRWRRGIELAERDLAGAGELRDEFRSNSQQIAIGGMVAAVIVLVAIFFMTVKP